MRPKLEPAGYYRRIPLLPHQLTARNTATKDVIVLCHLGIPRLAAAEWSLDIGGLVQRPRKLTFEDLRSYPRHSVETVHQCAGSPLAPFEPTRRVVNVCWSGARLTDVLADCGVEDSANYLWSTGLDHGDFSGVDIGAYIKDLPRARWSDDVLIAYELNGEELPPENGFPVRLVVPGFYGTNSVKWLARIDLAATRADGPFTTRWYNDPVLNADGRDTGRTTPVWSIAPESVIVSPAPDAQIAAGESCEVWGWAWADGGVALVDCAFGADEPWGRAQLEPRNGRGWQKFSLRWTPQAKGPMQLRSRAVGFDGQKQPADGRRNAIYGVDVQVF